MSKSNQTPATPSSDGIDIDAAVDAAPATDLETVVQQFWEKNRVLLIGLAVIILVAIFARSGLSAYAAGQVESAREDFAAATTDAELKAFASEHAGTALAGVALLQVADNASSEGRYDDAIAGYDAAAAELTDTVFADRIALGSAMATLLGGNTAGGETALRNLANNMEIAAPVRSEAIYHLAGVALAAGNVTELDALIAQIDAIAPGSSWAQRIALMRSSLASNTAAEAGIAFPNP